MRTQSSGYHKMPISNKAQGDLKGEEWKEIPDTGGYYLVSSFGRIKSLPRFIEVYMPKRRRSVTYYTKEKILTIKVREKWNNVIDQPYYECSVSIRMDGTERKYQVSRLVYHAFVKEIDFEKDRLMVMHKDGNGLDNHYKNLLAGYRSEVTQRSYNQNRHISPFALKTKNELKEISHRAGISRQKPVIQFSLDGKKVKRFESIKEASLQIGIPDSNIHKVLKGNGKTAGGYLWKYDDSK